MADSPQVVRIGRDPLAKRIRHRQGSNIRSVRRMRQMTVRQLADRVGVSEGAVSQWETGRFSPRQDVQVRIADALEVPWSTLFALDGEAAS